MSEFDAIPSATITADLGQGVVEQTVTSWSIDRTLSGGGLPGQARAASGSSVGIGSVSVESDATPWNTGAIKPAGRVTVSASEDVGAAASRVGTMVVRSVGAPSALSSQRDLSIEDDLGGLRGPVTIPVTLSTILVDDTDLPTGLSLSTELAGVDAAWPIALAARDGGFYTSGPTAPTSVLDMPLHGSFSPTVGGFGTAGVELDPEWRWTGGWGTRAGQVMLHSNPSNGITILGQFVREVPVSDDLYVAFTAGMRAGSAVRVSLSNWAAVKATPPDATYAGPYAFFDVRAPSGANGEIQGASFPLDSTRARIVVHWQRISGTSARVRARSSNSAAWSAWVTVPGYANLPLGDAVDVIDFEQAASLPTLHSLQVATTDHPNLYVTPNAKIAATGSMLSAILAARTASSWSMIQEVAAATLGAVWIDEDGVLTYRNREQLRGSGAPTETVYSLDKLDDVPWEVSTDDVADRVEVSYNPPAITQVSDYSATVWQSTEIVTIRAGQTATIEQDIDGAADDLAPWYPAWNTTVAPATRYSRWAASTLPGGGGPQPADSALDISAEMVNPSKVRIRIRNTTTGTLYTAGTDGTTLLTLRANVVARPSEPLTLSTGLPADKAIAPLSIDLGSWVQDQDTAQEILSWLTGTLSQPLPILRQVGVTPKASRRLGDVIVIRDPYTELASKALITGIHSSGEAGRYSQSLDLAILATTFDDMDRWSIANGITTFDQLDAFLIANGIDTFDKWDAYTARIGGNL